MHPIRRLLVGLFLGSLLVRALAALPLRHAGYFDAFYYYHLALNMAEGRGMVESVIWNYLDQPTTLPRPGNQYWMPATNLLAWGGIATLGRWLGAWRAAQLPFVIGSALLPPLAAWLSWREWRRADWAIGAGVLTLFSGFYFVYWVVPDNFTPFALAVAVALLAVWRGQTGGGARWWALAGLGAGLSHLARIDGALLVPLIGALLGWHWLRAAPRDGRQLARDGLAAALGYGLVMGPWWLRNLLVVGTPFPGGGLQTLWLRDYGEIFAYRPDLTVERYLAWGIGPIVRSKLTSLGWSALIVLGSTQFFLAPFIALVLGEAARRPLFRPFLLYTALLLTAMPLVFTFPATRGSLLHSSAALIPWMMALAPAGIDRAVRWVAARRRRWHAATAATVLGAGFVGVAVVVTLYLYVAGVWLEPVPGAVVARWNERTVPYAEVEGWLAASRAAPDERIFVGDPPAFHITTRRPALIIPAEGPATLTQAASDWNTRWLLLDRDSGTGEYQAMYETPRPVSGWHPVATFQDALGEAVVLYRLER